MTIDRDRHPLAKERIERQRELIKRIETRGEDASQAKSLLSALVYSLRLSNRRRRRPTSRLHRDRASRLPA